MRRFKRSCSRSGAEEKIDSENLIRLGGKDDPRTCAVLEVKSLLRDQYLLWRELAVQRESGKRESGILYYKENKLDRFLGAAWLQDTSNTSVPSRTARRRSAGDVPIPDDLSEDVEKPKNMRVRFAAVARTWVRRRRGSS